MSNIPNFTRYKKALEYCTLYGFTNKYFNDELYKLVSYHGKLIKAGYTLMSFDFLDKLTIGQTINLDLMNLQITKSKLHKSDDLILTKFENFTGVLLDQFIDDLKDVALTFGKFKLKQIINNVYIFDSYSKQSLAMLKQNHEDLQLATLTEKLNTINMSIKSKSKQLNIEKLRKKLESIPKLNK